MIKAKKKARIAAPIDPVKLKAYVERIENVETRIAEERDARSDIYTEVKASGMKPKMVRKIIKERARKDEDAAELAELEAYRAALAMPGATYRSVADKLGVPRSTLHRLVPRAKNGTEPPHDPTTGEIEDAAPQGDSCLVAPQADVVQHVPATPVPDGGVGAGTIVCLVDGRGPCPNTCALEGRCVWDGTPAPTVEDGAVAEPQAERVAPDDPWAGVDVLHTQLKRTLREKGFA